MVNDVAGGELPVYVLHADPGLDHQHHHMVGEVCDLVARLFLVLSLGGDDDLGALLADLLEDLVEALPEEIAGVGALRARRLPILEQREQPAQAEFPALRALPDGGGESRTPPPCGRRGRPAPP